MGWDIFDGLNSKVFKSIPIIRSNRLARLVWIQFFKRSLINFRKIALVPKEYNPKGLGLFLSGYCNLYYMEPKDEYLEKIKFLVKEIISLRSTGWSGSCWGYNFDWQARAFFQKKYTPSVVATSFIGEALISAHSILKDENLLSNIISISDFIRFDLNKTFDGDSFIYSYTPNDKTKVFNASLLGSRMLAEIYNLTKNRDLIIEARKSIVYCCEHQNTDGSWFYGVKKYQNWIDSFHTGYNLDCISTYQILSGDDSFTEHISRGVNYYLDNFFTDDGVPKYYHNSIYPVDVHSTAQLIITLSKLNLLKKHMPIVDKVVLWTIDNMQNKKGYFNFRKNKFYTIDIPYMRWSQSWMFYALSEYLLNFSNNNNLK